jgi:hypothetical protein
MMQVKQKVGFRKKPGNSLPSFNFCFSCQLGLARLRAGLFFCRIFRWYGGVRPASRLVRFNCDEAATGRLKTRRHRQHCLRMLIARGTPGLAHCASAFSLKRAA